MTAPLTDPGLFHMPLGLSSHVCLIQNAWPMNPTHHPHPVPTRWRAPDIHGLLVTTCLLPALYGATPDPQEVLLHVWPRLPPASCSPRSFQNSPVSVSQILLLSGVNQPTNDVVPHPRGQRCFRVEADGDTTDDQEAQHRP